MKEEEAGWGWWGAADNVGLMGIIGDDRPRQADACVVNSG